MTSDVRSCRTSTDRSDRLRVDAEEADAVLGRRGHRRDGGSVEVVAGVREALGAEDGRVRPARELRMREVDAGVEHGDRLAGAGRNGRVGADERPPVLGRRSGLDARGGPAGLVRRRPRRRGRRVRGAGDPGRARCRSRRDRSDPPRAVERPALELDDRSVAPANRERARRRSRRRGGARGERARGRDERDQAEEADRSGQATHATAAAHKFASDAAGVHRPRCEPRRPRGDDARRARRTRRRVRSSRVVAVSTFRETDPVGYLDQPRFLNAAAAVETELDAPRAPRRAARGRAASSAATREGPRHGPRTIDLDLLLYGDAALDEPGPRPSRTRGCTSGRSRSSRSPSSTPASSSPAVARWRACAEARIRRRCRTSTSSTSSRPTLELRLKREYAAVFGLFRYCVLTQDATYLCNKLDLQYVPQASYPFFHLRMEDVWVWDKNRPTRIIPRAEVFTSGDVTVEELRGENDEPRLHSPEALAERIGEALRATTASSRSVSSGLSAPSRRRRQHADASSALFDGDRLAEHWRVATEPRRTGDELGVLALRAARPRRRRRRLPLVDRAGARPRVRGVRRALGRTAASSSSARASAPGIAIRYDDPREVGPDRIANAVAAEGALRRAVHRRRLRHVDELRRRLARRGVRRRSARARDRDLDGRALRARVAAVRSVDFTPPPTVIGKTTQPRSSRGSSTASPGRSTGSSTRIRGELGADARVGRHRRARGADRAALADASSASTRS